MWCHECDIYKKWLILFCIFDKIYSRVCKHSAGESASITLVRKPGIHIILDLERCMVRSTTTGGHLSRKIRRDDIHRQSALQHVIQGGNRSGQHYRLHFPATNGGQHIDFFGQWRTPGDKAQRVLPNLVGRRAQDISKTLALCLQENVTTMIPA